MIGIPGLSIPRLRRRAAAAASYPLLDSLVAYWNLDEASGQRNDSHTNALHLTDNNTVGVASGGGPDGGDAASFVAANTEDLSRASEAALQAGNIVFTLTCWARLTTIPTVGQYVGLLSKNVPGGREYRIMSNGDNSGRFSWLVYDGISGSVHTDLLWSGAPSADTWYFLAAWFDTVAGFSYLSVNNSTPVSVAITGTAGVSLTDFRIGSRHGAGFLNGRMAYVGFWKRILTAAERTWLYNSGAGRNYAAVAAYTG